MEEMWVTQDQECMDRCNALPHLMLVLDYYSGDDRDTWELRCARCGFDFFMSTNGYEPDLNYCPKCCPTINRANADPVFTYDVYSFGEYKYSVPLVRCAADTPEYWFAGSPTAQKGRLLNE